MEAPAPLQAPAAPLLPPYEGPIWEREAAEGVWEKYPDLAQRALAQSLANQEPQCSVETAAGQRVVVYLE